MLEGKRAGTTRPQDIDLVGKAEAQSFFREQVEVACDHQNAQVSAEARSYLAGLLMDCVQPSSSPALADAFERPLTLVFGDALAAEPAERFDRLRSLGDGTLFLSGFFGENLRRRGIAEEFVASIGQSSYQGAAAAVRSSSRVTEVLIELAHCFRALVAVLAELAQRTFAAARGSEAARALHLYEQWARTGSPFAARELREIGLVPVRRLGAA